jgi:flagellar biosynthesis protein FlhF
MTNSAKKYRGRTPGEAMRKARGELGDDARLLSARRVSGPAEPALYEVQVLPAAAAARLASPDEGIEALRREMESLRETIARITPPAPRAEAARSETDPHKARCIELLCRRGMNRSRAERIAEAAATAAGSRDPRLGLIRALASDLAQDTGEPLASGGRPLVFVGPSGAGKTAVVAKLAAELVAAGREPVLVTADAESIAGEDALEAVAGALGLRVETAFLEGRLAELAERFAGSDAVLVDTPGRSPFERDFLTSLRPLVEALPGAEVLAVIPATADLDEAKLLTEGYAGLGASRVILTKLDELARPARLADLRGSITLPVAWVTFGREARGAASAPGDPRVVERMLGTALDVEASA